MPWRVVRGVAAVVIDVSGHALRVLDDFILYASAYPERLADAMWWYEDPFVDGVRRLKEAYDEAMSAQFRRRCPYCGEWHIW